MVISNNCRLQENEGGHLEKHDEGDHQIRNDENIATEISTDKNKPFVLLSLPNQITGSLQNCNNIQFGTQLMTSNINRINPDKDISCISSNSDDNCNNTVSDKNLCRIDCSMFDKILTIIIFIITLITISLVIIVLVLRKDIVFNHDDDHNSKTDNTTKLTTEKAIASSIQFSSTYPPTYSYSTTDKINPWLITYKEWLGVEQPQTCYKNLPPTNTIKFWYDTATCNTFESCTHILKQEAFLDIDGCHYGDVRFHYGVSEQGLVFECRSTNCESPPEYKKCNDSVVFIYLYVKYAEKPLSESQTCRDYLDYPKQMNGLINLIKYNQQKGVILKKPLVIYIPKKFCSKELYEDLNKEFNVNRVLECSVNMCNVDTCLEQYK